MKLNHPAQTISTGGILTAIAVLFQSSPIFLPGIGLLLSPLATLPIAMGAIISTGLGVTALYSATLVLLFISPQEAVIFLFTTGLLGIVLGSTHNHRTISSFIYMTLSLFIGINILTHVFSIAVFGDMTPTTSSLFLYLAFIVFSMLYSLIWLVMFRLFLKFIKGTEKSKYI